MKRVSLAARYRPQTFAEVAGQDMVKTVLSRATAEDCPAPAYLFSGTRGVGKTTLARIFAKALNCSLAPATEPCNQCPQCRNITQGTHVDVTEIDGASNNSVDDARALRENIGYAPMEGRYKIFIIDEAHMLSRNAFNALLKTLEEPPARVVFVFATTEAHKFPSTIVSRCQHFVFRHLSEDSLYAHLVTVLGKEGLAFEQDALRLIARRAAGSVRDGMSLLDQVLALGGTTLNVADTRSVLGVAGQEVFAEVFEAMRNQDCATVTHVCRQILNDGLDTSFFLREIISRLRDLFLLREAGDSIIPSLGLSTDEAAFLRKTALDFSAAHLHAAWQMALEARRGIVHNPEPGTALELFLLNLVMLPQLLPLENFLRKTESPEKSATTKTPPRVTTPSPQSSGQPTPQALENKKSPKAASGGKFQRDWGVFSDFCATELEAGRPAPPRHLFVGLTVDWGDNALHLKPTHSIQHEQLDLHRGELLAALRAFGAEDTDLVLLDAPKKRSDRELMEEFGQRSELAPCMQILGAKLEHCKAEN